MQQRQAMAAGLMCSALGKARGHALRLALVLELLWWCGEDGLAPPPERIGERAFAAAGLLVNDYFVPVAERVYGDAATATLDRDAATLARWIMREHPAEVHVRQLQREIRLPGLRTADAIRAAADRLVEADWLRPPPPAVGFGTGRARGACAINPRLWETEPSAAADACGERAAIVEHDGAIPRAWAEGFARLDPNRPPGAG
jgi:hypothetical protein